MFRRSRLSIKPNVCTAGRTAGTPQEAPSSSKDSDEANPKTETPVSVTESKSVEPPPEQTPTPGDCNDQNGEGASSSAIQRRKRFCVKPKVVSGRTSTLPRTPKSPIRPQSIKSPAPLRDKPATSAETNYTAPYQEVLSPKEFKASDESRPSKIETVSPAEGSSKDVHLPADTGKKHVTSCSQVKEVSPKALVPPSIPDREAVEISEKAKTLVSKTELTTSTSQFSLSQLLNDKSDLLRMEKARKLRQLLKQEMHKEKTKKYKARVKEYSLDPAKMTMRDLIHYLPMSNPMSSTLEDAVQENETVIPQSPGREELPERAQEPEVQPKILSPCPEETAAAAEEQEAVEEEAAEDEEALMVPQVKVAEDGSLIIDEESLTVEVQRMKGPNPIQDRDPIFERGSTTTYSSFRKGTYAKPWSTEETDMFFLAISMVGTDFTMICQLFPHRARSEIKNKFKKEERYNAWRIDKAFRERRKLDLEYFTKLLEKILEFQQNKKKLKSMSEKNKTPKTRKRKTKGKQATYKLSDVEEENEISNEEEEGEKENENLCNEKTSDSKPKTKRKRKDKDILSPEQPVDKKKNKRKKKHVQDNSSASADSEEAALAEDHLNLDQSEKTETPEPAKNTEVKLEKLSLGKALLPLGRKGCKKNQAPKSKAIISDKEGESTSEEAVEEQIKKDLLPSQQATKRVSDKDSSDEETTVPPTRPSRNGRVPRRVQPLNCPAKEDIHSSASETTSASPAGHTSAAALKAKNKTTVKRRRSAHQKPAKESKKPKLITLRASQSECSDDEEEEENNALPCDDENSTAAFVPASLCSPKPVVPEVEETMEELDMLAHMSDVLGMSKNALCPDASCEQVQNERGTVEPCEHQLDLLVDVIDFLSEHTEASEDESYNEAAQTLLAIGNLTNLAQPTQDVSLFETSQSSEIDGSSKSSVQQEQFIQAVSEPSKTESRPTDHTVEDIPVSQTSDTQVIKPSDEQCSTQETVSSPQLNTSLKRNSLQPRKGRFPKIKPKPNIGCVSRTTKLSPQTVGAVEESQQVECDIATTRMPQSAELSASESVAEVISFGDSHQESLSLNSQVKDSDQSETSGENQETSHLSNEQQPDPRTTDTASDNILISIEAVSELQTGHSSTTESISVCQDTVNQLEDIAIATPSISSSVLSQDGKYNFPMEQTAEHELKNTQETHMDPPLEKSFIPSSEYPKPVGNIPTPELEIIKSTHETPEYSTAEEKNAQVELVNESDSISESSKQSTPQRRRWFPKVKPKPNLVSSPRTTKSRVEVKDNSKPPDQLGKCSSLNATSEQQTLKRETLQTKPEEAEQFKSVNVEINKVGTEQVACCSEADTNTTTVKSGFQQSDHSTVQSSHVVSLLKTNPQSTEGIAKLLHSDKISEDHNTVQQLSANNQGNNDSCQLTECASSDSSKSSATVCQPQDITLKATDVCLESGSSSTLQIGSEFCTEHRKPVEGAVEHSKELPHIDAGPHLGLDQVQDSSVQNETAAETTFEYPSLLFPNMLSDQVPSDPDEPFFILSLTEIPVCPSGEVVDTRPEPYLSLPDSQAQQSNAGEHTVALAAGIDDSLSNIHIPTPEKAALKTGLISVEEYLPSEPAVDISIVVEPQENTSVLPLNLPEVDDNIKNDSTPSTKRQPSVGGDVDVKPINRGQNLTRMAVVTEANRQAQTGPTQEPPDVSAPPETIESMGEIVENIETKESDVTLFTGKIKKKTARNNRQNRKTLTSSGPPCGQKSSQTERQPPEALSANNASISSSLQENQSTSSTSQFPASHQSVSIGSSFLDDEPTNVSQYFFSDVFTEVESDDNSVAAKTNTETACSDKTESQTAETRGNKGQDRKTKASSDLPCGQKSSQTERPKTSVFNMDPPSNLQETPSTSSTIVPTTNTNQQGTKGTRGKGSSSRKNKVSCEAKAKSSQLLKKSSAALKSPEALSPDSLKETPSTSSTTVQPQTHVANQQSSLQSTSEFPASHQSVSIGSSFLDDEPTNVSQYFFSDVFTEVESDDNSVTGKTNQETACSDKTESQTAETRGNKGQNGKAKASSDALCGQKSSQTERPEASAANNEASSSSLQETPSTFCTTVPTTDTSQQDTKRTRGKGSSSRKNKASDEAEAKSSQSPRKSSAALKSPEALSQDSLKETPSTSSTTVQPQTHVANQQSLQSTSELLDSYQTDSVGSSFLDEEPTSVSQYFLSDVFTEVEEECKP